MILYFQRIAKILVVDDSISKGTYLSMKWPLDWVFSVDRMSGKEQQ